MKILHDQQLLQKAFVGHEVSYVQFFQSVYIYRCVLYVAGLQACHHRPFPRSWCGQCTSVAH